jgi:hypothetical protein
MELGFADPTFIITRRLPVRCTGSAGRQSWAMPIMDVDGEIFMKEIR